MQNQQSPAAAMGGTIKWFNAEKRYGFVTPDDGSSDIFLHITTLKRANLETAPDGAAITFEMVQGQKGWQVSRVVTLDTAIAAEPPPRRRPRRGPAAG